MAFVGWWPVADKSQIFTAESTEDMETSFMKTFLAPAESGHTGIAKWTISGPTLFIITVALMTASDLT